jgi:hypothetical protein
MARAWGWGVVVMLAAAGPAWSHDTKRTDKCGCHHQFGLRHCHPNKETPFCEAPAAGKAPLPKTPPAPKPPPVRL